MQPLHNQSVLSILYPSSFILHFSSVPCSSGRIICQLFVNYFITSTVYRGGLYVFMSGGDIKGFKLDLTKKNQSESLVIELSMFAQQ